MATITTTIAAARITQVLFHHPLFTTTSLPLLHKSLSFTQLPKTSLFSSHCKPLYCSIKESDEIINSNEENEENPERKVVEIIKEREVPNLTVKEKKEINSYANSLGDKLKSQQVGKSGVTNNVVFAFDETLEANELLKLKIHRTCPGELEDVVDQLERATGSVVVGQIGRTVIFYRPSITKLNAEKKKEQARKLFAQKREKAQAAFMKREQVPRRTGRGQFTSRRSEKITS